MPKTPASRPDVVEMAIETLDGVFQEYAQKFDSRFSQATRTPRAQVELDAIFDRTTTHTQHPNSEAPLRGKEIFNRVREFVASLWATMEHKNAVARGDIDRETERIVRKILSSDGDRIDPRLITATLLRNLGLEQYIAPKGTKRTERILIHVRALPDIQDMLDQRDTILRPNEQDKKSLKGRHRMWRITKGKNEGYVMGTQHAVKGDGTKQAILYKSDINNGALRIEHIAKTYAQEAEILAKMKQSLEKIHANLAYWQDIKQTSRLQEIKENMLKKAIQFEHVRDADKQKLRERIEASMTLQDRTGRDNPAAMRAHLRKTIPYIESRRANMYEISMNLQADALQIHGAVEGITTAMDEFLDQVEEHRDEKKRARSKKEQLVDLSILLEKLDATTFEPYLSFAKNFRANLEKLIAILEKPKQEPGDDPSRLFLNLFILAKFQRAYQQLQKMYRDITLNGEDFNPLKIKKNLEEASDELYKSRILGGKEIHDYDEQAGQVYHTINSLKKCCDEKLGKLDPAKNTHEDEVGMKLSDRMKKRVHTYIPNWAKLAQSLAYPATVTSLSEGEEPIAQ